MKNSVCTRRRRHPSGQGITEYAACLAFVSCVIALAFNIAQGSLFSGVSQSYSTVSGSLANLNNVAQNHGNNP